MPYDEPLNCSLFKMSEHHIYLIFAMKFTKYNDIFMANQRNPKMNRLINKINSNKSKVQRGSDARKILFVGYKWIKHREIDCIQMNMSGLLWRK